MESDHLSLTTRQDVELYQQLSLLHPGIQNHPDLWVDDLLNGYYPAFNAAPRVGMRSIMPNALKQTIEAIMPDSQEYNEQGGSASLNTAPFAIQSPEQPLVRFDDTDSALPAPPAVGAPLGLFGPREYFPTAPTDQQHLLEEASSTSSSSRGAWVIQSHHFPMWVPYSDFWGPNASGASGSWPVHNGPAQPVLPPAQVPEQKRLTSQVPEQQRLTSQAPEQQRPSSDVHEQKRLTWQNTRVLRVSGPTEIVNPEYVQWYWDLKSDVKIKVEHIVDHSDYPYTADLEIVFDDHEHAEAACELMNDPEFPGGLIEPVNIGFLPDQ